MNDIVTKSGTEVAPKTQRPRLHKVILLNDDYTPREFVVLVLKAEPDYHVVERLVVLAETMPLEAVQCLTLMVQGDKEGWEIGSWRDDSRKILAIAIASGNSAARQAAIALVNRLAARGMPDYKDLL